MRSSTPTPWSRFNVVSALASTRTTPTSVNNASRPGIRRNPVNNWKAILNLRKASFICCDTDICFFKMSSYVRRPLDDAWLYDSDDFDDSNNSVFNGFVDFDDSEPDCNTGYDDIPLLLKDFYTTEEEMYTSIQTWATKHKYAFQRSRSKPVSNHRKKVLYQCGRSGPPPIIDRLHDDLRRLHNRVRCTSTKKTGYEFFVNSVQVDDHHWEIR
jgi:hypothetical protein